MADIKETVPKNSGDISPEESVAGGIAETEESLGIDAEEIAEDAYSGFSDEGGDSAKEDEDDDSDDPKKKKRKKKLIITAISGVTAAAVAVTSFGVYHYVQKKNAAKDMYTDTEVTRVTIQNTITGSSYIEPNDSYNVTTITSGDITSDYFSEGDTVKKGDKLYQFEDDDAQNSLESAQNALSKAQQQYVDAVKQKAQTVSSNNNNLAQSQNGVKTALSSIDNAKSSVDKANDDQADAQRDLDDAKEDYTKTLAEVQEKYDKCYVTADFSGKISNTYVENGDTVQKGANVAELYDDSTMKLRLPFNEFDASGLFEGATAEVSVVGSSDVIYGTVTSVASSAVSGQSHTMLVYATIEVENPGALSTSDTGSAVVNGIACADTAAFEYAQTKTIVTEQAGKIRDMNLEAGDSVNAGDVICYIELDTETANSLDDSIDNAESALSKAQSSLNTAKRSADSAKRSVNDAQVSYNNAVISLENAVLNSDTYSQDSNIKNAQISLKDARLALEKAQDGVDDYTIEAPIEGTVVTKNAKAGDTIDTSNSTDPLCVIYDLSSVKFSIDVDETEIALCKVGQEVTVTADACDGTFTGKVTKVPVDGTNENGVTTYTVEVQIEDYGDLLPGMNCDATVVVEESEDTLAVPVDSVNRGNIVFVKDDGKVRDNDVTDILKGAAAEKAESKDGKDSTDDKADKSDKDNKDAVKDGTAKDGKTGDKNDGESGKSGKSEDTGTDSKPASTAQPKTNADAGSLESGKSKTDSSGSVTATGEPAKDKTSADSEDSSDGGIDISDIPMNIEVPDGYRAIVVETGINDTSYIEIKSGLEEGDMVRTLNANASSADASFGSGEETAEQQMGMPGGGMSGGMPGGGGGMGGGMPGGGGGRGGGPM